MEGVGVNLFGISEYVGYGDGDGWIASIGPGPGPNVTGWGSQEAATFQAPHVGDKGALVGIPMGGGRSVEGEIPCSVDGSGDNYPQAGDVYPLDAEVENEEDEIDYAEQQ